MKGRNREQDTPRLVPLPPVETNAPGALSATVMVLAGDHARDRAHYELRVTAGIHSDDDGGRGAAWDVQCVLFRCPDGEAPTALVALDWPDLRDTVERLARLLDALPGSASK